MSEIILSATPAYYRQQNPNYILFSHLSRQELFSLCNIYMNYFS